MSGSEAVEPFWTQQDRDEIVMAVAPRLARIAKAGEWKFFLDASRIGSPTAITPPSEAEIALRLARALAKVCRRGPGAWEVVGVRNIGVEWEVDEQGTPGDLNVWLRVGGVLSGEQLTGQPASERRPPGATAYEPDA